MKTTKFKTSTATFGIQYTNFSAVTRDDALSYAAELPQAEVTTPFGPDHLVLKVAGKMFAIIPLDEPEPVGMALKFPPEELDDLRAEYPCLERASHMSPVHWSAVRLDGSAPTRTLTAWIRQSYNLVLAGLPKKIRANYPTL